MWVVEEDRKGQTLIDLQETSETADKEQPKEEENTA
jgi:hypothetical protein